MKPTDRTSENWKQLCSVVALPVSFLIAFALLHSPIEDLFKKVVVGPILSKIIFVGHPIESVALFSLLAIIVGYAINQLRNRFKYSNQRLAWGIAIAGAYAFERFYSECWEYAALPWPHNSLLKAADLVVGVPLVLLLTLWMAGKYFAKPAPLNPLIGFKTDKPTRINPAADPHQLWRYVEMLTPLLMNTETGEGSFAIGITGEWGSGKTTFINTLEEHLKANKSVVQLHFNPWLISDAKGITGAFFSELSYQLSLKTDSVTGDLAEYVRAITVTQERNPVLAVAKKLLPTFRWERNSTDELRGRINRSLRLAGTKFIIYMDDLDRLDNEEITEVLRIIRNSADFANLLFIVAYDKTQINVALRSKFSHGSGKYSEKIFQYEFHLPPLDRTILLKELNARLIELLSDGDKAAQNAMFENRRFNSNYSSLKAYLRHYRDISRFENIFRVHYPHLHDEIFLPDLYKMMFLRLKYPAIATLLYEERSELLTLFGKGVIVYKEGDYISLEKEEDGKEFRLATRLKKVPDLKENELATEEVLTLAKDLFPPSKNIGNIDFSQLNDIPNSTFTIRDVNYFERYFNEDLLSRLSNVEFQKAFAQNKDTFLAQVKAWLGERGIAADLIKTLERRVQYNNREDFDKVLSALALIADYPGERNDYTFMMLINEQKFTERIAFEKNDGTSKIAKLFGGYEVFQDYVRAFLKENLVAGSFRYQVAQSLIKWGGHLDTFEASEVISMVRVEAFEKRLSIDTTVHDLLFVYFFLREKMPAEEEQKMKEQLQIFIFTKDLEGFMKWVPRPCSMWREGEYEIDREWADKFFGDSIDDFVAMLDMNNLSPAAKELLQFLKEYNERPEGTQCISFEFRNLKVRILNGGWMA